MHASSLLPPLLYIKMSKNFNFEMRFAISKTHMSGLKSTGWNLYGPGPGPVYQSEPKLGSEPEPVYKLKPKTGSKLDFLQVKTSR